MTAIHDILDSLNRDVLNQLHLASSISHNQEAGRAREEIMRRFLRALTPTNYEIDTGFVIDAHGNTSKQVDIVVYRSDYHPVFEVGGVRHFLVESVAIVIEFKKRIKDRATLVEALDNIKSVKELDRTNHGKNRQLDANALISIPPRLDFQRVNQQVVSHQVFGAVVTEESMTPEVLDDAFFGYLTAHADRTDVWPNLYTDVNKFTIKYHVANPAQPGDFYQASPPPVGDGVGRSLPSEGQVPPLIDLAHEVVDTLRVHPLIDFSPSDYFPFRQGQYVNKPLIRRASTGGTS